MESPCVWQSNTCSHLSPTYNKTKQNPILIKVGQKFVYISRKFCLGWIVRHDLMLIICKNIFSVNLLNKNNSMRVSELRHECAAKWYEWNQLSRWIGNLNTNNLFHVGVFSSNISKQRLFEALLLCHRLSKLGKRKLCLVLKNYDQI